MNITETERKKIENWIEARTPEPPRYILEALEKAAEPRGNRLVQSILTGELPPDNDILQPLKRVNLELYRKGDSWYLSN